MNNIVSNVQHILTALTITISSYHSYGVFVVVASVSICCIDLGVCRLYHTVFPQITNMTLEDEIPKDNLVLDAVANLKIIMHQYMRENDIIDNYLQLFNIDSMYPKTEQIKDESSNYVGVSDFIKYSLHLNIHSFAAKFELTKTILLGLNGEGNKLDIILYFVIGKVGHVLV